MNYEKVIMSIAIMTVIFSTGIPRSEASDLENVKNKLKNKVQTERILETIEASDYESWRRLVNPNSKIAKSVSYETFNEFIKARNLARQAKYEEALKIYEKIKADIGVGDDFINRIIDYLNIGEQ